MKWLIAGGIESVLSWKLTSTNKAEYTQDTPQTSHALWGFDIMNFKGIKILPSEKQPQNIAQKNSKDCDCKFLDENALCKAYKGHY